MKTYKIPLKIYEIPGGGNHLLIKCTINDNKTFMLIDTGASNSVFDPEFEAFTETEMIPVEEEMKSSGFNSTIEKLLIGSINKLKLSHFTTNLPQAVFTSLAHVNSLYKSIKLPYIAGILGCDFLIKHGAIINFHKKILYLEKKYI